MLNESSGYFTGCCRSPFCGPYYVIAVSGFAFDQVNFTMTPFYPNHVDYAVVITMFLPFNLWLYSEATTRRTNATSFLSTVIFLFAIYLSYTRACYVAVCFEVDRVFLHKDARDETSHSPCLCLIVGLIGFYFMKINTSNTPPQQVRLCTMSLVIMFPQPLKERTFLVWSEYIVGWQAGI